MMLPALQFLDWEERTLGSVGLLIHLVRLFAKVLIPIHLMSLMTRENLHFIYLNFS